MTQVWNVFPAQLDALTEAKISVLRSKGANQNPALLHDLTAATNASDTPTWCASAAWMS
jgi:hypothetical protein